MPIPRKWRLGEGPAQCPKVRKRRSGPHPEPRCSGQSTVLLRSRSIMKLEFEWNDAKAEANLRTHGVNFELARTVFKDAFAIERLDDRGTMARSVLSSLAWRKD